MQNKELEKQFEKLIKDHELLIFKVCAVYASHGADRQDLFQEIVIQLWKAYPKFKGESKLSTWLYRVAINTAISGLWKEKNFVRSYEPHTLPGYLINTDDNKEKEEYFKQLYHAIDQLNQIEKAIVMLYLEDKSYEKWKIFLELMREICALKWTGSKKNYVNLHKINNYGTGRFKTTLVRIC